MRFSFFCGLGLVALCAIGCSTGRTEYVVYRDVPDSPSITVIPRLSHDLRDIRLCTALERHLIGMGIAVINAPPEHEETVTHDKDGGSTESTAGGTKSKSKGDSVAMYFSSVLNIKSTFAIIADSSFDKIRVLRMDNQQLVAVIDYNTRDAESYTNNTTGTEPVRSQSFRTLIESIGFKPKLPANRNNSPP